MILAMGDVGWPALLFAIAAMGAAIGLKRHLVKAENRISAVEADLAAARPRQ